MFLTLVFKKLKINLKSEKCGAHVLVIKQIYTGKDDKKGNVGKFDKEKEKEVERENSMSSFNSGNAKDMRTKMGKKVEVLQETFKMMKNIQKAMNMVNNILDDTSKLQQAIAQDRDGSLVLLSQRIEKIESKVDLVLEKLFSDGAGGSSFGFGYFGPTFGVDPTAGTSTQP